MIKFLQPLFSENKRTYSYDLPPDVLRSRIQAVFQQAGVFQGPDVRGNFTDGNTFQMDSPVPADTNGVVYRSKLYASLRENGKGTIIETRTRVAVSLRGMFWVFLALGIAFVIQKLIAGDPALWQPLIILILGPPAAVIIANVNNAVIEDRYRRYIHKACVSKQHSQS